MRLRVYSDLHLEQENHGFGPVDGLAKDDVIVLAGDIHEGADGIAWARKAFADQRIVYVAGNHEFFNAGEWDGALSDLRKAAMRQDVHFLENASVDIDGMRFLGCTLWSDFMHFGSQQKLVAMREASRCLPDFHAIWAKRSMNGQLTPQLTIERHVASRKWLVEELKRGDPARTVVVTHHFPNRKSVLPKYANQILTAAFGVHFNESIMCRAGLWIHGHTHNSARYRIGDSSARALVRSNPRGYQYYWLEGEFENAQFDPEFQMTCTNGVWHDRQP